jgi:lycopene cyclase domain-containing protein
MKWLYLLINFCSVIVPILFSFHPKLNFYKNWKEFFIANAIVAFIFILWDLVFTHIGVWGFNPTYISGIYFLNLPIEEILFFICIPYACVFTYHCLNLFIKTKWPANAENIFVYSLAAVLLFTGIYFYDKLYTASTFISLAFTLFILKIFLKVNWLGKLLTIYPILLIPFFIVNGMLTGSGLPQPVVWYNNAENMGIRMFTIPFEDIFYGFELIMLNIAFYEYFLNKDIKKATP